MLQSAAVPSDGIPLWDFDAPSDSYRDTSAAAITASALLELAVFENSTAIRDIALNTLSVLGSSPYIGDSVCCLLLLLLLLLFSSSSSASRLPTAMLCYAQSTNAVLTHNGHDCGDDRCTIIESDYYLYEALLRVQRMGGPHPSIGGDTSRMS